jgi:hypothetical protein
VEPSLWVMPATQLPGRLRMLCGDTLI